MKAITILQPFAHWISAGEKFVENRNWNTNYRGQIAIHAGKSMDYLDENDDVDNMVFGGIVAIANLTTCIRLDRIEYMSADPDTKHSHPACCGFSWRVIANHEHTHGTWCWILEDVSPLQFPVMCSGKQGLWNVSDEILQEVRA